MPGVGVSLLAEVAVLLLFRPAPSDFVMSYDSSVFPHCIRALARHRIAQAADHLRLRCTERIVDASFPFCKPLEA
jgi:hypothetical protein